jgi:hypothetical protein
LIATVSFAINITGSFMSDYYTLDKRDIKFFTFLGLIISFLMWLSDKVNLPPQMERGILNELFFDNISFVSIGVLFISIAALLSLAIITKKYIHVSNGFLKTNIHLSRRLSQLASPTFFVVIGSVLPMPIFAWYESDSSFIRYIIIFLFFAFFILAISWLARIVAVYGRYVRQKTTICITMILVFSIIGISLLNAYFDYRPMKIEIEVELSTYNLLEEEAKKMGVTTSNYIEQILQK